MLLLVRNLLTIMNYSLALRSFPLFLPEFKENAKLKLCILKCTQK